MNRDNKNTLIITSALLAAFAIMWILITMFIAGCEAEHTEESDGLCKYSTYCPEVSEPNEMGYYIAYQCLFYESEMYEVWLYSPCVEDGNPCGDNYPCYVPDTCKEPCDFGHTYCSEGGHEYLCIEGNLCNTTYYAASGRMCWK